MKPKKERGKPASAKSKCETAPKTGPVGFCDIPLKMEDNHKIAGIPVVAGQNPDQNKNISYIIRLSEAIGGVAFQCGFTRTARNGDEPVGQNRASLTDRVDGGTRSSSWPLSLRCPPHTF